MGNFSMLIGNGLFLVPPFIIWTGNSMEFTWNELQIKY